MRLRRVDPSTRGYGRRRRGRGFSYFDEWGRALADDAALERIAALAIPPAWRDVWICPRPDGHIQATGVDAAGRTQYLYHPHWRAMRDEAKFDHVLQVARLLPRLRRRVRADLRGRGLSRERVLAAAAALLDSGLFRVGGDEYATGDDATYGLATLLRSHLSWGRGEVVFNYLAKGGTERIAVVTDPDVRAVLRALYRRPAAACRSDRLLAYRQGRQWREVRSDDVNAYLREASGCEITAKDFRTWHATVLAAVLLAEEGTDGSPTRQKRLVARVMRGVAEELGNTPAVARSSYVDPRIVDEFLRGTTIEVSRPVIGCPAPPAVERAVLALLTR